MTFPMIEPTKGGKFRQYAVVPMEAFAKFTESPQVKEVRHEIETTSMNDLSNLDAKMKEILVDANHIYPDTDTQMKALREVVQRFVDASKAVMQPIQYPPLELPKQENVSNSKNRFENQDGLEREIRNQAGKTALGRATGLFTRIMEIPELAWNHRGELIVNDKLIPDSNISTLVVDAAKPYRSRHGTPIGALDFAYLLARNNVSSNYIGNPQRYVLMNKPLQFADSVEERMQAEALPKSKRSRADPDTLFEQPGGDFVHPEVYKLQKPQPLPEDWAFGKADPKRQAKPAEPPKAKSPKKAEAKAVEPTKAKSPKKAAAKPAEPPKAKSPKKATAKPAEPPKAKSPKK